MPLHRNGESCIEVLSREKYFDTSIPKWERGHQYVTDVLLHKCTITPEPPFPFGESTQYDVYSEPYETTQSNSGAIPQLRKAGAQLQGRSKGDGAYGRKRNR